MDKIDANENWNCGGIMKLLYSQDVSTQSMTGYLPQGSFAGFQICYTGVNDTGETANLSDIGNLFFQYNQSNVYNVPAKIFSAMNNIYKGASTATSTISSNYNFSFFVPCATWGDRENVMIITNQDKAYFKLDFAALAAKSASGVVKIYSIEKIGRMDYLYKLQTANVVASGASVVPNTHYLQNLYSVILTNISNLTDIQIQIDDKLLYDVSKTDYLSYFNQDNRIETAISDYMIFEITNKNSLLQSINSQIKYKYTFSGATTLEQVFATIELLPQQSISSRIDYTKQIAEKLTTTKQTEAVKVIDKLETESKVSIS